LQIAIIFYYLCVVGLQFVAPVILCVGFTLMNKTLGNYFSLDPLILSLSLMVLSIKHYVGGYGWFGQHHYNPDECDPQQEPKATLSTLLPNDETTLVDAREQWLAALSTFHQVCYPDYLLVILKIIITNF
jgi:hypothetical protein